jgi:hypothetical protein
MALIARGAKSTEKLAAIVEDMIPTTENHRHVRSKKAALNKAARFSVTQDITLKPHQWAEEHINWGIMLPMLDNAVVVNGMLVNAREWVRSRHEDRYRQGGQKLKEIEEQMEKEIAALRESSSLEKLAELKDGKLTYPVSDLELSRYRAKIIAHIKQANGAMTDDARSRAMATHLGRSFMVFKGWIPPLFSQRIKGLDYNAGTRSLEWGRFLMFGRLFADSGLGGFRNLIGILSCNDHGIAYMQGLWERKKEQYLKQNGKELEFSEAEFMDMMRHGIKGQMKELLYMMLLMGIYLTARAAAPDDDDDNKGKWRLLARQAQKVSQELTFYYNPLDIQSMANGNIIPAMSLLVDGYHFLNSVKKEILTDGGKSHPLKDAIRMVPIAAQLNYFAASFSDDYAREMGIRTTDGSSFFR